MDLEMLRERARIIRQVRSFFDERQYLELDTPLLSDNLIPESCLEVFQTSRILPGAGGPREKPYWLIPSPELWMKKIIAKHRVNVYQICKCFRNGESSGFLHNPEFTMLEYYTINADYMDSLRLTEELFAYLAPLAHNADSISAPFERITVADAFSRYAGFDLFAAAAHPQGLQDEARRLGIDPAPEGTHPLDTAALFDLIFIHAVEPHLKQQRPVALIDYPAFVSTMAKTCGGGQTSERWELYYKGIELANCFSEETDAHRVKDFFENESAKKKENALVQHDVDADYWKLFNNFPSCSGVALGLDRLIMALCGKSRIDGVLPFMME